MPESTNSSFIAPPPREPSLQGRVSYQGGSALFSVGLVVLILSGLASGGVFLYAQAQKNNTKAWQDQIVVAEKALQTQDLTNMYTYADTLDLAKAILAAHVFPSNTFNFLSNNTHQKVQFTSYTYAGNALKIELVGKAASYETVGEQVQVLEANPDVAKVDFGGLSLGEQGSVSFTLSITFKPSLLRFVTPASANAAAGATL